MIDLFPARVIAWLNGQPAELSLALMVLASFGCCLLLFRAFGALGLYAHIVIAVLGANIQVTKVTQFALVPEPVALGTALFASSYLATDMLAEHYGAAAARRGVWLGFAAFLAWTLLILLTLGYPPLTDAQADAADAGWALAAQPALMTVFQPAPALFAAGMIAYLTSQLVDVWLFDRIRRSTGPGRLWLRNSASTALSGLLDNTIFSLLAWIVFAASPLPLMTVIVTYILGTYGLRLLLALLDTPAMYLSRGIARHHPRMIA